MSLDLHTATARLMRDMATSEVAVADALVAATALMHSAALAQRDVSGASAIQTHSTMLRISKMAAGLIDVQAETRRAHGQLLKVGQEMGATEEPTCPGDDAFTSAWDRNAAAA
ncbi:hypothetical protein [Croceicoccus mobilis]|uniref:Uncharacterized protein n=1 Tax=Croceicoccus mobilis TaxID=1703339 RepID=A0A916YR96_9SPHN|nr:hypothetical protein [Croceicoccus mobilis]GGD57126.1 hypothetical protein GCM10010990_02950 [Croceicoccus mobilis]